MMYEFSVLGHLEMRTECGVLTPRGSKIANVFALLVLRANQTVGLDVLADELWDGSPPQTMTTTLRTHVYHLRRLIDREAGIPSETLLLTTAAGYLLRADRDGLDYEVFARATDRGGSLLAAGRPEEAGVVLRRALELWRGPALVCVRTPGPVLRAHLVALDELRSRAVCLRIEADLRCGRHRELVPELHGLVAADPLNEWLHARLIEALHLSGRREAALRVFQQIRRALGEELGLDPGADLTLARGWILDGDGLTSRPHRTVA